MLRRLLKWILEDESRGVELYPDTLKIEEGIITDADEQLICIEAHGEDIENIFRELMKDRKFEAMIDGFGVYVDRENIDLEDGEEPGYFLTVLLIKKIRPY